MYEDMDWTGLLAGSSATDFKSFIHDLATLSGASSFALYIPYKEGDEGVGICPGATSLTEVTTTCASLTYKSAEDSGVSIVNVDGAYYWRVEGVTGSGGFSAEELPETGMNILPFAIIGNITLLGVALLNSKKKLI